MPAVITHDQFGREVYDSLHALVGDSRDEFDAFLLGNQGPDVFFFGQARPSLLRTWGIGTAMHKADPAMLLAAYRDAVAAMDPCTRSTCRAYVLGMACHYALDSTAHPFVYAQQKALCGAGVEGLDERDGHEVHAEIESELDVLVLSIKAKATIEEFDPSARTLRGSLATLRQVSLLSRRAVFDATGRSIPDDAFEKSVRAYRSALRAMHSPLGVKRELLGRAEELFRRHSFVRAMSHRNGLLFESDFDNRENAEWTDPWTGEARTESFWQLYDKALGKAKDMVARLWTMSHRDLEDATDGLDFDGAPVVARIVKVEEA